MEGSWLQGEARTLESLATNQENYAREAQGDRAKLMKFYNSEFQVCHQAYVTYHKAPLNKS